MLKHGSLSASILEPPQCSILFVRFGLDCTAIVFVNLSTLTIKSFDGFKFTKIAIHFPSIGQNGLPASRFIAPRIGQPVSLPRQDLNLTSSSKLFTRIISYSQSLSRSAYPTNTITVVFNTLRANFIHTWQLLNALTLNLILKTFAPLNQMYACGSGKPQTLYMIITHDYKVYIGITEHFQRRLGEHSNSMSSNAGHSSLGKRCPESCFIFRVAQAVSSTANSPVAASPSGRVRRAKFKRIHTSYESFVEQWPHIAQAFHGVAFNKGCLALDNSPSLTHQLHATSRCINPVPAIDKFRSGLESIRTFLKACLELETRKCIEELEMRLIRLIAAHFPSHVTNVIHNPHKTFATSPQKTKPKHVQRAESDSAWSKC